MSSRIVYFNVGGIRFATSISTIMKYPDSMLATMIEQEQEKIMIQNKEDLFIDRDGDVFKYILDYLRNDKAIILPSDNITLNRLLLEVDFFQLSELKKLVQSKIDNPPFVKGDFVEVQLSSPGESREFLLSGRYLPLPKDDFSSCDHTSMEKDHIQQILMYAQRNGCLVGEIMHVSGSCANVKFYYTMPKFSDGYVSSGSQALAVVHGDFILHVPVHILKKHN